MWKTWRAPRFSSILLRRCMIVYYLLFGSNFWAQNMLHVLNLLSRLLKFICCWCKALGVASLLYIYWPEEPFTIFSYALRYILLKMSIAIGQCEKYNPFHVYVPDKKIFKNIHCRIIMESTSFYSWYLHSSKT
jgi:hypothetical protein